MKALYSKSLFAKAHFKNAVSSKRSITYIAFKALSKWKSLKSVRKKLSYKVPLITHDFLKNNLSNYMQNWFF